MRRKCVSLQRLILLAAVCPGLMLGRSHAKPDFSTFVVVGDSLSAGFENFSLVDSQQRQSFANMLAQQAGTSLVLPLVSCPGAPNVLRLISIGPPPDVEPLIPPLNAPPAGREDVLKQVTNLAVPGQTVGDALNKAPSPTADALTNLVLGFPNPFPNGQPGLSQVNQAIKLNPSTLLVWIGNNDALLAALSGDFTQLTPITTFAASYTMMMQKLHSQTNATIITANIPDVTQAPFFTPVAALAQELKIPVGRVSAELGVGPFDFLRPGAVGLALQILTGQINGPLPAAGCPSGNASLGATLPCALTVEDALRIRIAIGAFNSIIAVDSAIYGATLVDTNGLINQLHSNGYDVAGMHLSQGYLGGLVSLDGIHPTKTLNAILANTFIRTLNTQLGTKIPAISVADVVKTDALVPGNLTFGQPPCPAQ